MKLEPGRRVLERYIVRESLGEQRGASLYRADHVSGRRSVVLKVLARTAEPTERQRFERQAQLLSQIHHPNVVSIEAFGFLDASWPCFAVEDVPGERLDRVLETRGALSWKEALSLMLSALAGLEAIHRSGTIHRNLQPASFVLASGERTRVKLVDLGLAKPLRETDVKLTEDGVVLGTPVYMAPEQLFRRSLDARSDLYGLALTFHEVMSGQLPFGVGSLRNKISALKQVMPLARAPDRLDPIPRPVALALREALAHDPADRPATARAYADLLRQARRRSSQTGEHARVGVGPSPTATPRDERRRCRTPTPRPYSSSNPASTAAERTTPSPLHTEREAHTVRPRPARERVTPPPLPVVPRSTPSSAGGPAAPPNPGSTRRPAPADMVAKPSEVGGGATPPPTVRTRPRATTTPGRPVLAPSRSPGSAATTDRPEEDVRSTLGGVYRPRIPTPKPPTGEVGADRVRCVMVVRPKADRQNSLRELDPWWFARQLGSGAALHSIGEDTWLVLLSGRTNFEVARVTVSLSRAIRERFGAGARVVWSEVEPGLTISDAAFAGEEPLPDVIQRLLSK